MPTFLGLLIAPSIALGAQSLMLSLVTPQCSTQTRVALHAVAVLAFLLTAACALLSRRDWRLHAMPSDSATQGPDETRRFLAASATAVAALSALLVLVMWFAAWVLSPCLP
ncbi:hypothetical protein [Ramlibacter algicola]|uniref:Uncharacterized protein n=1 Tax=Ramlibacter algicola TaxID=2795217 RepID=A0A934UTG9_9BURK|nr:hypothetical protein [Ramlibacter algicola]MBK0394522.1 hypothetical protein [Ramlibacter algicola]